MGKKEGEYFSRIREGIPVEQASDLLQSVQEERVLEKAPVKNLVHHDDPRAQHFSDLWFSQRHTLTVEQKNRIGLSYIRNVLSLDREVAEKFTEGDLRASHEVGLKQSGIPFDVGTSRFWTEVRANCPDVYTDEDIRFLSETGGVFAVLELMSQVEVTMAEKSPVLRLLATNAHAYK